MGKGALSKDFQIFDFRGIDVQNGIKIIFIWFWGHQTTCKVSYRYDGSAFEYPDSKILIPMIQENSKVISKF